MSERKLMSYTLAPEDVGFYHRKLRDDDTYTAADVSTKKHVKLLEALPLLLVFHGTGEGVRSSVFSGRRKRQRKIPSEENYTIILPDTISYTLRSSRLFGLLGTPSRMTFPAPFPEASFGERKAQWFRKAQDTGWTKPKDPSISMTRTIDIGRE